MAEIREYSADETMQIVIKERDERIKRCQYPFHVTRYELFKKYGMANLRPGLRELVRTRRLAMGETGNDFWFQTLDHDDEKAKESCKPKA